MEQKEQNKFRFNYPRYGWLDQLRGIVLFFLIIAVVAWGFSSNLPSGPPPIGPTWLNHGFQYGDYAKPLATLIDMGSQIFMFVLGLSAAISFRSNIQKSNVSNSWIKVVTRMFVFFWLNEVGYAITSGNFDIRDIIAISLWAFLIVALIVSVMLIKKSKIRNFIWLIWAISSTAVGLLKNDATIWTIFFSETLALLAWGTFFAVLSIQIFRKPDLRIISIFILIAVHLTLWGLCLHKGYIPPYEKFFEVLPGTIFDSIRIPFEILGMGIVSISATCVVDWMYVKYERPENGFKYRIIPFGIMLGIIHFITDFFQPAENRGITVSIATITVTICIFLTGIFYIYESVYQFKIPFMTAVGRNSLVIFLLLGIIEAIYSIIWRFNSSRLRFLFPGTLGDFVGLISYIIPFVIILGLGWILNRFKIYIKF